MVHKSSTDWSDIYFFLQMVRHGSARATAQALQISHSKVSRRITSLESSLATTLFNKLSSGYQLTADGELLLEYAEQVEQKLQQVENQLLGNNAALKGTIKITTADAIANHLLMNDIAGFQQQYPEVDVEIVLSSQVVDLNNQDIDLALRLLPNDASPDEDLVGQIVAKIASCYYASPEYLDLHDPYAVPSTAKFIGWGELGRYPDWIRHSPFPHLSTVCRFNHSAMQVQAAKALIGITLLPCFIGDNEAGLIRVPGCEPQINHDLWLLTPENRRNMARVKVLKQRFITMFQQQQQRLVGKQPTN